MKSRADQEVARLLQAGSPKGAEGREVHAFTSLDDPLKLPVPSAPPGGSRRLLHLGWAAALTLVLGLVAVGWEGIVARLARTPRAGSQPALPVNSPAHPSPAEAAIAQARLLLAAGEAQKALEVLDGIPAQDPNWPYARQVRAEAEAALGGAR